MVQVARTPASATVNNWGTMTANGGGQGVDFNKILSGSNVVNNDASGVLKALEADAVRPGVNGVVNDMAGGLIDGGRHGITGGPVDGATPFTTTVGNDGTIRGNNGSGRIDGVAAYARFDGTYADVTAVPEPANVALLLAGLEVMGAMARRSKPGA